MRFVTQFIAFFATATLLALTVTLCAKAWLWMRDFWISI